MAAARQADSQLAQPLRLLLGPRRTDAMCLPLVLVWFDLGPRTGISGNGLWSDQLAVFAPHCRPLSWRATFAEPHRAICGCHSAAALMLAYFCRLANASTSCGRQVVHFSCTQCLPRRRTPKLIQFAGCPANASLGPNTNAANYVPLREGQSRIGCM